MMLTCPSCGARFRVKPEMFAAGPRLVRCTRCRHQWRGEPDPDAETPPPAAPAEPAAEVPADDPAESPAEDDTGDTDDAFDDRADDDLDEPPDEPEARGDADGDTGDFRREPVFDTIPGAVRPVADERRRDGGKAARRRTPAWVWAGWVLILAVLVLTGLALAFLKAPITEAWPPSQRLYQLLEGAETAEPAAPVGLTIETSRLSEHDGVSRMELGLRLTNATDDSQPLPIAVIHLLDGEGGMVKTERIRLNDDPLAPKESRTMRLVLEDVPEGIEKVRADTEMAQ